MGQVQGSVTGLLVEVITSAEDHADDDDPIEEKLLQAYRAKKRGQFKAAAAHAADAVNMIASRYDISCGASL